MSIDTIPAPGQEGRPTCGDCAHKVYVNDQLIECWGVPPTPCPTGKSQNIAGQMQYTVELLSPRLPATRPCCALFVPGGALPILGPVESIRRN